MTYTLWSEPRCDFYSAPTKYLHGLFWAQRTHLLYFFVSRHPSDPYAEQWPRVWKKTALRALPPQTLGQNANFTLQIQLAKDLIIGLSLWLPQAMCVCYKRWSKVCTYCHIPPCSHLKDFPPENMIFTKKEILHGLLIKKSQISFPSTWKNHVPFLLTHTQK